MATVVNRVITGSTSNVASYPTGSFTPTVGDLLAGIVHCTGSTLTTTTLSASANGITFTQVGTLVHTLSGNISVVFVANQLVPASPVAMTCTFGLSASATGAFVEIDAVTGMTLTGSSAIKQTAFSANLGANTAWTATFSASTLTSNPLLGFIGHAGGATVTQPTGWTQLNQPADQATPAQGFETAKADSGQTTTAYTWTSSLGSPAGNTRANVGAVEFDTSSGTTAAKVRPIAQSQVPIFRASTF